MYRDDAYPSEYYRQVRANKKIAIRVLAVLGSVALLAGYAAVVSGGGFILLASIAAAVFLLAAYILSESLLGRHGPVRVIPYFRTKVQFGGMDTWYEGGRALARNCTRLDEMAQQAGLRPISTFGFTDDYGWGDDESRTEWHDPGEGLRTVVGLLELLEREPQRVDNAGRTIDDLRRIRLKLEEAIRRGVPFCFHVRMSDASTSLEFDTRVGTYF